MTENNDWAQRNYLSQLAANTKKSCAYFGRYRSTLLAGLALVLTAPELAAVVAGYEALAIACDILQRVPDPAPEPGE